MPYPERFTTTVYPGDIPPLGAEVVDGCVFLSLSSSPSSRSLVSCSSLTCVSLVYCSTPETVVSYKDWTYLGCFADNQTARAFPHSILDVESVDACLDAAADAGYGWAGLEYYGASTSCSFTWRSRRRS